jgi:hypothetical protein
MHVKVTFVFEVKYKCRCVTFLAVTKFYGHGFVSYECSEILELVKGADFSYLIRGFSKGFVVQNVSYTLI